MVDELVDMIIHNSLVRQEIHIQVNTEFIHLPIIILTSGMSHPKYLLRSKRSLMACCSSVRNKVFVSFC